MRNLTKLACAGAALVLMVVVTDGAAAKPGGGPQPVTQACTLVGDATGGGTVGITASSRGPLTMTIGAGTQLAATFDGLYSPQVTFAGTGRVLKKQGRLDFWFQTDGSECRPLEWGEEYPPVDPKVCCYELLLLNGVYSSKKDAVSFGPGTTAQLVDYCAPERISPDGATASLLVQFK